MVSLCHLYFLMDLVVFMVNTGWDADDYYLQSRTVIYPCVLNGVVLLPNISQFLPYLFATALS